MKKPQARKSGRVEMAVAGLRGVVDTIAADVTGLKQRFDGIDRRLEGVDKRLEGIDERLDRVDERFDRVDERFDRVDERFDRVDERFDRVDEEFARVRREIRDGDEAVKVHVTQLIESVRDDVRIFAEGHVALELRVTRLEKRTSR